MVTLAVLSDRLRDWADVLEEADFIPVHYQENGYVVSVGWECHRCMTSTGLNRRMHFIDRHGIGQQALRCLRNRQRDLLRCESTAERP